MFEIVFRCLEFIHALDLKPEYRIGEFDWILIDLFKSVAFSLQTPETSLESI